MGILNGVHLLIIRLINNRHQICILFYQRLYTVQVIHDYLNINDS